MTTATLYLNDQQAEYVDGLVDSGEYESVSAAIRAEDLTEIAEIRDYERSHINTGPTESPVRSEMEARIIGNRLWNRAERLEDCGMSHVATETKAFARRFHSLATTREDLADAEPKEGGAA